MILTFCQESRAILQEMPKSRRPSEKLSEVPSKRSHSRSRSRSKAPSSSRSRNSRRRDDDSLEHSECTQVLSPGELDFQPEPEATTFQLPSQLPGYKHLKARLQKLQETPTKKNVVEFIREQIRIKFSGVKSAPITDHLQKIESARFWDRAIPHMLNTILSSPMKSMGFLKPQSNCTTTLTRLEAFTVLSHMFFVTLIGQGSCDIANLCYLFSSIPNWRPEVRLEKLKCYICYFQHMCEAKLEELSQIIIFQRLFSDNQDYITVNNALAPVQITKTNIEEYKGELMVDFANMVIGGGFLKNGAVQQQIMFVVCPQLGISRLICGIMEPNDAIVIHGFRQYCEYEGYAETFKFKSATIDKTPVDVYNKSRSSVIAIDALDFSCFVSSEMQFQQSFIVREIHKAYVGFGVNDWIEQDNKSRKSIVSGKWGCGAFRGDTQLKFIIQWLSCSWINRKFIFVNWGEDQKNQQYQEVVSHLKKKKTKQVFDLLISYGKYRKSQTEPTKIISLFEYIKQN